MAGLRLSGLASGMDTDAIISQLLAVEGAPRTRIALQESAAQARRTGLNDVTSKLNALKLAAADLRSPVLWTDTQSVVSTDETKLTARRVSGAGPGAYEVRVDRLAAAERRTYDFQSPASATPLEIYNKDGSLRTSVALAAGATIDDAVAAINANADAKLYAVKVGDDLVLAAKQTGADSEFSAVGAGTQLQRVAGVNAQVYLGADLYERSSNVVTDVIPGVELTLKGTTAATTVTVGGPTPDRDAVKAKVKAFVEKYNAAITTLRTDLDEKKVTGAKTATDAAKGALFGDNGLQEIVNRLRTTASATVDPGSDADSFDSLAAIGISTGAASGTISQDAVAGKLVLDEAKLNAALDADPLAVQRLLGGVTGTDGVAQAFESAIATYTAADGQMSLRVKSVDDEIKRVRDALTRFDARLERKEDQFRKQFTALEQALSRSQSMQADLSARLASLGG